LELLLNWEDLESSQKYLSQRIGELSVLQRVLSEFGKPNPRQLYLLPIVLLGLETLKPEEIVAQLGSFQQSLYQGIMSMFRAN